MTERRWKLRNTGTGEETWVPSGEWQLTHEPRSGAAHG